MQNKENIKQIADRMFGIANDDTLQSTGYDFNKDVEDAIRKIDEYDSQHKTEQDSYINRLDKTKNKPIIGTCPWCGNYLVLRINSKNRNEFAGCSSFPRCKYTEGFP